MKDIYKKIKLDLYRYSGKISCKELVLNLYKSPGFRFSFFFRISKLKSRNSFLGFICYQLYKKYSIKYGFQIPLTVEIGSGLALPHFGGIVVNSKSIIGENCNLLHNVTLGNNKVGRKVGAPVIGNNVFVGAGAVIIGKVIIGDNVLIAPNAFVNIDIPDGCIAIGNPCKVIIKENSSELHMINSLKNI